MRVMEILAYQPDDQNRAEGNADTDLMDRLASAFTHDGLIKALWTFGSTEQQPVLAVNGRRTGPLPDVGMPAVPGGMVGNRFGPDSLRREFPGIHDHDQL